MVEVRKCSFLEFGAFRQLPELVAEYAQESSIAGLPTPTYHEAHYLRLERAGVAQLLVATLDDALIGFAIALVNVNPHYDQVLGVFESFFVAKAHRKSGAGLKLRKAAEQHAAERGAIGFLIPAPKGGKLARVLERDKAYRETNRVFFRSLT